MLDVYFDHFWPFFATGSAVAADAVVAKCLAQDKRSQVADCETNMPIWRKITKKCVVNKAVSLK